MNYPALRRERLARCLDAEQIDAVLVSHPVNVTYLTGFTGDSSFLVLTRGQTILVSDGRYAEQIAEECPGLETYIRPPGQPPLAAAAQTIERLGSRAVGFESGHVTVAEFERLHDLLKAVDLKPGPDRVEKMRAVKDASELAQIREAIVMAEKAFAMFRSMLRPSDPEKELHDAMERYIRRAGGKCSAFPPIVAVGPRSALPHAPPTAHTVAEGVVVLVDWGASGPLYKCDLTRVLLARKDSPDLMARIERVYQVVRTAQETAIRAIRPGVAAKDVDAAARTVIAEAGFGPFFSHGLGHGIGLVVHEAPSLKASSPDVLEPGMVVTVEPGIYLTGEFGIRLEDDVLVTPDGCEVLTHVPKDWPPLL